MKVKLLTIVLMSIVLSTPSYANYFTDMSTGASATVKEAFVATTGITFWFEEQAKLQRASIENHTAEEIGNKVANAGIIAYGVAQGGAIAVKMNQLKNKIAGLEELTVRLEAADRSKTDAIKSTENALALQKEYITALQEAKVESSKLFNKVMERLDLNEKFMLDMSKRLEP